MTTPSSPARFANRVTTLDSSYVSARSNHLPLCSWQKYCILKSSGKTMTSAPLAAAFLAMFSAVLRFWLRNRVMENWRTATAEVIVLLK
ncbi:hypothetical protein ATCV1_z168L [Acanthocystis turfacea chlorella virus 1]|uniref:Uncharacterized protein z168L n=1 Tax=Chlorovirus heliozoae TaxID=322019 RepID=A7K8C8_9PHYC|nr:hypothetical protein ATCV1_z168L [Acanthocystis turfacea chlorella virus 1]ABT16302.1 hypothetical protein ATCV1_z168L [Acanthocystis turfacea chlorella virus 1]